MFLVVGLGNPDIKYLKTMHNMGFMAIDMLAYKLNVEFNKKAFKGIVAETYVGGEKVVLLKPLTYMNLSGDSVREAVDFYKIPMEKLIVLYDDLDLPIGSLRVRPKGSSGTHNGMRDIVKKVNSENFARIRIGTKPKNNDIPIIDYVLSNMKKEDEPTFKTVLTKSCDATLEMLHGKTVEEVMCKFNG